MISESENDVSEPMAKTSFPIDFTKLFYALNQATHTGYSLLECSVTISPHSETNKE